MIKPLLTLTCTSEGAGSHSASDSEFNSGKAAYEQLLHKEDLHYVAKPDTTKLEVIAPYHAIESAVVTRSSETVEDPVDSLCKSEEGGGSALGLWTFNETLNLAPMGTEWHVTWTITGTDGESIKFDHYSQQGVDADAFQLCSSALGMCAPVYFDGVGWEGGGSPLRIEFTGGDDIENPDFVAWLNANATPYAPPTVSGCWQFNDVPDYDTVADALTSFTSNGQTWDGINSGNSGLRFSRGAESLVVYGYNSETYQDEWTAEAYKNVCFTGEAEVSDVFYAWLTANATKVN